MSVMHWPFCPAFISCCYQHVFYFVQINMDGWMDGCITRWTCLFRHCRLPWELHVRAISQRLLLLRTRQVAVVWSQSKMYLSSPQQSSGSDQQCCRADCCDWLAVPPQKWAFWLLPAIQSMADGRVSNLHLRFSVSFFFCLRTDRRCIMQAIGVKFCPERVFSPFGSDVFKGLQMRDPKWERVGISPVWKAIWPRVSQKR